MQNVDPIKRKQLGPCGDGESNRPYQPVGAKQLSRTTLVQLYSLRGILNFCAICQIDMGMFVLSDENIRDLCHRLLAAQNDEAIKRVASVLRQAIHEHCEEAGKELSRKFGFFPPGIAAE